jgi:hypothetical protein
VAHNDPHICTVYDIGVADRIPFIVMELLRDRLPGGIERPVQVFVLALSNSRDEQNVRERRTRDA